MVIPIWTSAEEGITRIAIKGQEAEQAGLIHDSVLICDYLTTVPSFRIKGRLRGRVPPSILKKVTVAVRTAIGDPSANKPT